MAELPDRMLKWFATDHIGPPEIKAIIMTYKQMAYHFCEEIPAGPERTVALRKLVESKDCMVRAWVEGQSKNG